VPRSTSRPSHCQVSQPFQTPKAIVTSHGAAASRLSISDPIGIPLFWFKRCLRSWHGRQRSERVAPTAVRCAAKIAASMAQNVVVAGMLAKTRSPSSNNGTESVGRAANFYNTDVPGNL
jgi:hypothetical protein